MAQAINIYHGRPSIPVGANHGDEVGDPVDKMSAEKLAKDTAAFHNTIIHNHDAEEQTILNRKVLARQENNNVTYLTVGHTKGLYDLLVSAPDDISPLNGMELVNQKVKRWVALGALGAHNKEGHPVKDWNFFFNGTAPYTKYLVDSFPKLIYFIDGGKEVMTGKTLKNAPPGNIVRTAYRDWLWWYGKKTLDDQRPSWDLVAVYFAVEGTGDFLKNLGQGWLAFDPVKGCQWHAGRQGTNVQYYIKQKENVNTPFARYLNKRIIKNTYNQ